MSTLEESKYVKFNINSFYSSYECSIPFSVRNCVWRLEYNRKSFKNPKNDLLRLSLKKSSTDSTGEFGSLVHRMLVTTTCIEDNTNGLRFLQETSLHYDDTASNICIWEMNKEHFIEESKDILDLCEKVTFLCDFGTILNSIFDDAELINEIPEPLQVQYAVGCEGLSLDFSNMLKTEKFSDLEIKCGDNSFRAHKNILSARSPVFAAMMRHYMSEQKDSTVITVSDIDSETFSVILLYLYTGKLPVLSKDKAIELYRIGDRCAIDHLKKDCIEQMKSVRAIEDIFEFLVLADSYNDEQFKDSILQFIKTSARHITNGDKFRSFKKEHPILAWEIYDACND